MSWPFPFGYSNFYRSNSAFNPYTQHLFPTGIFSDPFLPLSNFPPCNFPTLPSNIHSEQQTSNTMHSKYQTSQKTYLRANQLVESIRQNLVQNSSKNNVSKEKSENYEEKNEQNSKIKIYRRRRNLNRVKNQISHNCSLRNDTKNIPKNYGKAMLSYIQKNNRETKKVLDQHGVDYLEFMMTVKHYKTKINTIHDMREMWGQNEKENQICKCIRILSYHFMRIKCLPYIFNSRVKNFHTHIKYRKKIMEGLEKPDNFTKIKEF